MTTVLVSSFAKDVLIKEDAREVKRGGPALFISEVLRKNNIQFKMVTSKEAIVEIDMKNNAEKGRIKQIYPIKADLNNNARFVLISTLLDEFKLKAFGRFCCLDIQGYVRDGTNFGKKKFFDSEEIEKFAIVKATKEEIEYIPKARVRRINILLLTDGANGFEVIQNGRTNFFAVDKLEVDNTIGAGDTFFAAFCLNFFTTRDIFQSAEYAEKTVSRFLIEKNWRFE